MDELDGRFGKNIYLGSEALVVQKIHRESGELTKGQVQSILTRSLRHPHGIKVRLSNGIVGRVKKIIPQ